jgi:hypothetical protein
MEKLMVMFPSDLQGTSLENLYHWGYDATLEENQDRVMNDFWKFCEKYCSSKDIGYDGHTIFIFDELVTFKRATEDNATYLYDMGLVTNSYVIETMEYLSEI